jgi:hypothetical protein
LTSRYDSRGPILHVAAKVCLIGVGLDAAMKISLEAKIHFNNSSSVKRIYIPGRTRKHAF